MSIARQFPPDNWSLAVYSKQMSKPGYERYEVQDGRQRSSQIEALNQIPGIRISKLQARTRQKQNQETKGYLVQYHYKLAYRKLGRNKDQRSDGLTDGQTGVLIHWDIKHTKRIMGCEEGLNNHKREYHTFINQTIRIQGKDTDWNHTHLLYKYTAD